MSDWNIWPSDFWFQRNVHSLPRNTSWSHYVYRTWHSWHWSLKVIDEWNYVIALAALDPYFEGSFQRRLCNSLQRSELPASIPVITCSPRDTKPNHWWYSVLLAKQKTKFVFDVLTASVSYFSMCFLLSAEQSETSLGTFSFTCDRWSKTISTCSHSMIFRQFLVKGYHLYIILCVCVCLDGRNLSGLVKSPCGQECERGKQPHDTYRTRAAQIAFSANWLVLLRHTEPIVREMERGHMYELTFYYLKKKLKPVNVSY